MKTKSMRESSIEKYLVSSVKTLGGISIKLISRIGLPDRLVILPGGIYLFVELKTATGKISPLQAYWRRLLIKLGCKHYIVRSKDEVYLVLLSHCEI
jgi:hypothetical protein